MSPTGRFITFEGGEGTGKSTQARRLAAWLRDHGQNVTLTREPGGSPGAEAIRELLLAGRVAPFGAEAEAILFAVARADHVAETIRPALARGDWVISDRFADSSRAYQGCAGVDAATLARLERIAVGDVVPDLTLVLDMPVSEGLLRASGRSAADRFESEDFQVHEDRRRAFLALARAEPERCVVIDACGDEEAIAAAIRAAVAKHFGITAG